MNQNQENFTQSFLPKLARVPMLQGAAIALVLIAIFLAGVKNPDPEWGNYWMLKPLIVVPIVGAFGGLFYFFMSPLRQMNGWVKLAGILLSIVGYIIALWMGSILGLNGTLWN